MFRLFLVLLLALCTSVSYGQLTSESVIYLGGEGCEEHLNNFDKIFDKGGGTFPTNTYRARRLSMPNDQFLWVEFLEVTNNTTKDVMVLAAPMFLIPRMDGTVDGYRLLYLLPWNDYQNFVDQYKTIGDTKAFSLYIHPHNDKAKCGAGKGLNP